MPLSEGTKLSSRFHAVAAGVTTVIEGYAGHKSGQVDPIIAGVMGMAGYLFARTASDKIYEGVTKIKRHFYQEP
jgi:hypothetical protein